MKQQFKGRLLTRTKTVNNILRVYDKAKDFQENDWYKQANLFALNVSKMFNVPLIKVCGVIASLSPLKSWDVNKMITIQFFEGKRGLHTGKMIAKAESITELENADVVQISEILRGNKIVSFFLNIYDPSNQDVVTIDRHALCIAVGEILSDTEQRGLTKNQYDFFVQCYKMASIKRGVSPLMMQSVTWEQWRKQK